MLTGNSWKERSWKLSFATNLYFTCICLRSLQITLHASFSSYENPMSSITWYINAPTIQARRYCDREWFCFPQHRTLPKAEHFYFCPSYNFYSLYTGYDECLLDHFASWVPFRFHLCSKLMVVIIFLSFLLHSSAARRSFPLEEDSQEFRRRPQGSLYQALRNCVTSVYQNPLNPLKIL